MNARIVLNTLLGICLSVDIPDEVINKVITLLAKQNDIIYNICEPDDMVHVIDYTKSTIDELLKPYIV